MGGSGPSGGFNPLGRSHGSEMVGGHMGPVSMRMPHSFMAAGAAAGVFEEPRVGRSSSASSTQSHPGSAGNNFPISSASVAAGGLAALIEANEKNWELKTHNPASVGDKRPAAGISAGPGVGLGGLGGHGHGHGGGKSSKNPSATGKTNPALDTNRKTPKRRTDISTLISLLKQQMWTPAQELRALEKAHILYPNTGIRAFYGLDFCSKRWLHEELHRESLKDSWLKSSRNGVVGRIKEMKEMGLKESQIDSDYLEEEDSMEANHEEMKIRMHSSSRNSMLRRCLGWESVTALEIFSKKKSLYAWLTLFFYRFGCPYTGIPYFVIFL